MLGNEAKLKTQESYFNDIDPRISFMWWYPRYTNFAYENGIVDRGYYFRPDENITMGELTEILDRTLKLIEPADEKTNP
jgi:hypothetical protein